MKQAWRRSGGMLALLCLGGALAGSGCGARSGLPEDTAAAVATAATANGADGGADTGTDAGACAASCADNTRGTWRLEDASHTMVGYLFTFDGTVTCNGSTDSFLLVTGGDQGCSRNGDYDIQSNTDTSFHFSADNLGGVTTPECGGDPIGEVMTLSLSRPPCDPSTYRLVISDSNPGSPYDVNLSAFRCRCDIGFEPCADPLPDDPCAP